jgi:hypothetical protein
VDKHTSGKHLNTIFRKMARRIHLLASQSKASSIPMLPLKRQSKIFFSAILGPMSIHRGKTIRISHFDIYRYYFADDYWINIDHWGLFSGFPI